MLSNLKINLFFETITKIAQELAMEHIHTDFLHLNSFLISQAISFIVFSL